MYDSDQSVLEVWLDEYCTGPTYSILVSTTYRVLVTKYFLC